VKTNELADRSADQSRRFARAFALIEEAIAQRAFPGAALAVTHGGELLAWQGFGRFTYEADSPVVQRETLWDLASLTKPLAAASMAMRLFEDGRLQLDTPVAEILPEFAEGAATQREWRRAVTVRMLLEHSSGLPAHRKLYLEATGREAMLAAARAVPLDAEPGSRTEYSDIGYIILGELLERIAGRALDEFCCSVFFESLTLHLHYSPQPAERLNIPPTVIDNLWRHRTIRGEVNDENASAMGGVAGHAGLFGDARSVARFAECFLRGGEGIFRPETVRLFTTRNGPKGERALGWDVPTFPSQSGSRFSPRSFGHLGYTGTSLWCDPERGLSVTLLTNRTWPDATNQAIKRIRPALHDWIVSSLDNV
jgi:CubicO group peptidase (beta-lactamase class C family)